MISRWRWLYMLLTRRLWFRAGLYGVAAMVTALIAAFVSPLIPEDVPDVFGAEAVEDILKIIAGQHAGGCDVFTRNDGQCIRFRIQHGHTSGLAVADRGFHLAKCCIDVYRRVHIWPGRHYRAEHTLLRSGRPGDIVFCDADRRGVSYSSPFSGGSIIFLTSAASARQSKRSKERPRMRCERGG